MSGTASQWGSTGNGSGQGPSTVKTGTVTVSGVGSDSNKIVGWTGPGGSYPLKELVSKFSDAKGNLSVTNIKNLFIKMDAANDPFLKQFMKMYGITDKKVAKAVWDDAASYAASLAKTGQDVDFINDVLNSKTFIDTYLNIPSSLTGGGSSGTPIVQKYTTNYFSSAGKPNAAAVQLLVTQLTGVLGHVPSADEVKEYQPLLSEMYQQQKAGLFTKSYNQKTGVTNAAADASTWLRDKITAKHQARVEYGKESAQQSNINDYVQLAKSYGINPFEADGKTLTAGARQQLAKIDSGKISIDDAVASLKAASLAQYPYLKTQFDAGLTLDDVASVGKSAIAKWLERDPNTISVDDPLVQRYLQGDGSGVAPIYKFEAFLRSQPEWQYTENARSTFADLAMNLGQRFGMVG